MITMHKNHVKHYFNRALSTYDQACDVQLTSGVALLKQVAKHVSAVNHLLDIGCGTGKVTEQLCNSIVAKQCFAVDFAEQLLFKAAQCNGLPINFLLADADALPFKSASVDLVFSNLALQWCPDLPHTFTEIHRVMPAGGVLAMSIPLAGTFAALRASWSSVDKHAQFKPFHTIETLRCLLQQQGYRLLGFDVLSVNKAFANLLSLLKSIKNTGANYPAMPFNRTMLHRQKLRAVEQHYQKLAHNHRGELILSYQLGLIIAAKQSEGVEL